MNTQSSIARAWSWSVERSPLLNACRYIVRRQYAKTKARDLINAAKLPDELYRLIDTTVTRTKLWRSERADIARELIAHTQDALEAGRTPDQIIKTFGNPKRVAKLLRRATKRKRPLYWRTLRNARRAVVSVTLLLFITYGSLAARFYIGQPNITKNYAVMINSQNDAYTEDQKAWPVYKEVETAWSLHILETQQRQNDYAVELNVDLDRKQDRDQEAHSAGLYMYPWIPTDHHDYAQTVQLFKDFEPQLRRLRQATHRPIMGIQLGFNTGDYRDEPTPPSDNAEENPSLINLLLPHLGIVRRSAKILAFDTLIAARESDSDRTYKNLSAMLALSRHKNFDQTLISDLVNTAIAHLSVNIIAKVIRETPGILTRDHLVALSHELAITTPTPGYSFEGEIMMFEDLLQRAYTDDGHGNGRLTQNGMQIFLNTNREPYGVSEVTATQLALGPISSAAIGDRRSQLQLHQRMIKAIKDVTNLGPLHISILSHQEDSLNRTNNYTRDVLYSPVQLIMPGLSQSVNRSFQSTMTLDAAAAVLAIEIYKYDTGQLPESLSNLTPNYLPALPQDLHNPNQPLQYKIIDNDYILYSIGSDGDDDNAHPMNEVQKIGQERSFTKRYPAQLDKDGNIILDHAGNPKLAPPEGPNGDWILFDMTPPQQKTKEPDQSPALESIN